MNPFNPTFNDPPKTLYGYEENFERAKVSLANRRSNPYRGVIIQGKRGTGKTSILTTISKWAGLNNWIVARTSPNAKSMTKAILDGFISQDPNIFAKKKLQSLSINVLGSGAAISFSSNKLSLSNFQVIYENLAKIAFEKNRGLLIVIDEAQNTDELKEICDAFSYVKSLEDVKVALYIAGLPVFIERLKYEDTITFFNRAEYFYTHELSREVTKYAIESILSDSKKTITDEALEYMAFNSKGYPYLIQLFGFEAYNATGTSNVITLDIVKRIEPIVMDKFTQRVIVIEYNDTFKTLSKSEQKIMRAISLPEHSTLRQDLLERSGLAIPNYNAVRASLITRGLIEKVSQGEVDYVDSGWQDYFNSSGLK